MKTEIDLYLIIFLSGILIVAAVNDLLFQKIPNLLVYPAMAVALGYHFVMNGLDGLLFSTGGLALGIAVLILPYMMGGMGAGDAKLMGAVGAILGIRGVFIAFLFTAIAGGIYALILLLVRHQAFKGFWQRHAATLKTFIFTGQFIPIPGDSNERKPKLCYGIVIAIGTLFSVFLEFSGYYTFPI
ncbi:MAG: prepilin peptidase [Desulfobacteraceae bacterium]|nr:prepilin peptidase [Desulfobacteraceae bacterium]MBC2720994.1 prepilin peptidase [Desulfobacteraceae bacterium]